MKSTPPASYKEIITVSWPLIISMASFSIMRFIDQVMVSWYDQDSMAAAGSAGATAFVVIALFFGTSTYINTFIAQFHGAKRPIRMTVYVWQGIYFAILGQIIFLLCIPLGPYLFNLFGHDPKLVELEQTFYSITLIGGFNYILMGSMGSFFSGQEKTRITMVINVIGHVCNIIFNYFLIYGNWIFPEWGLKGAAWSSVFAAMVSNILYFTIFLSKKYRISHRTHQFFQFRLKEFLRMLRFGVPSGTQWFLDHLSFTLFLLIIGTFHKNALFVTNVAFAINMLVFMPIIGLSRAVTILVGKYIGKGEIALSVTTAMKSLGISVSYMFIICLALFLVPDIFIHLFKEPSISGEDFQAILDLGIPLIRIIAIYSLFDSVTLIFFGVLMGGGDTRFVLIASLVTSYLCFIIPVFIMVYVLGLGLQEIWLSFAIAAFVYAAITTFRYFQGKWKSIDLTGLKKLESVG